MIRKKVYIPARYKSSRLPGKPLIKIKGREMILRVCDRVSEAVGKANMEVLTDSANIKEVVEKAGYTAQMTSENCLTGTDRIAEAIQNSDIDVAINVQGDEPLINPFDVKRIFDLATEQEVINCYAEISIDEDINRSTLPKVVFDENKKLLYMSRAAIPNDKKLSNNKGYKQICIYSFPRKSLELYGKGKNKTPLESIEDIEILRLLEKGWKVNMVEAESTVAVDEAEDVIKVESLLND